eukprot:357223-Chlamydomonas_euryale.AAC.2
MLTSECTCTVDHSLGGKTGLESSLQRTQQTLPAAPFPKPLPAAQLYCQAQRCKGRRARSV